MPQYKKYTDLVFKDLTTFGGFVFFALVSLVALAFQEFILFYKLIFGFFLTLLTVILFRMIYHKNRPQKQEYKNFVEKMDALAFPSWHASRIVFLALIFTYLFNNNYLTTLFIITTLLVVYSRVYLKKHDWVDVLGGIVLGILAFWLSGMIF